MISEWKEYKLNEITEPIKETYNPDGSDDYAYIGLEHIEQKSLRLSSVGVSSDVTSNKFLFKVNDILFGKLRPYFRKVVKPGFYGICSTDIWVFRAKKGFDQNYLYYFLANWDFVNTANSGEGGTRMPRADWNFLKTTEWSFPSLAEQQIIASVFSSLDDKIDLLHRQNKTLEQLAETLFRQSFVEEANKEWDIRKLNDVCIKINSGGTPSTKVNSYYNGDINWYSTKELNDNYLFESSSKITKDGLENSSAKLFPVNTIIIAIFAAPTVGRLAILGNEAAFNQAACGFIVDETKANFEYLYLHLLSSRQKLNDMASGSAQQNLNVSIMKEFEIVLPPFELLLKFRNRVRPIFQKIKSNTIQIKTLTQVRDALLPKLISGEVRVA